MELQQVAIEAKILLDMIKKKYKILEQILNITENQQTVLSSDPETEFFEEMKKEKQSCIEEIQTLDLQFQKAYERIRQTLQSDLTPFKDTIKQIKEYITLCSDLSIKIQTLEEKNRRLLIKQKQIPIKSSQAAAAALYNKQKNNK